MFDRLDRFVSFVSREQDQRPTPQAGTAIAKDMILKS